MDLKLLREKIDVIDDQLLKLFEERMALALEVAKFKQANNLPILNQDREDEILERVSADASMEISYYAYTMFSTLLALSRAYQEEITEE